MDIYRLTSPAEMIGLGYEEYFYSDGVTAIEWAQKIDGLLPEEYLRAEFEVMGELDREIVFIPFGQKYVQLVEKLRKWSESVSEKVR